MAKITGLAIGDNRIKLEDADSLNQKIEKKQNNLTEGIGIGIQDDTIETYAVLSTSLNGTDIPIQHNTLELEVTKETVGLDKVDNTSDLEKPISNLTKEALELKADKADIGDKANLTTTNKTTIVDAINELEAKQVPVATDTEKGVVTIPLDSDILNTDGSLTIKDTIAHQTEIERLDNENTTLTEKIDKEIQDRKDADDLKADKTVVDALLKVYNYEAGLELKIGYLINVGNKLYIAKEDFTTVDWNTDEPKLEPANTDTISCVTYEAGLKISKGQLVIYNNNIWICTADIEATTDWATDAPNMVDSNITIDLSDYYTKNELNPMLALKQNILIAGTNCEIVGDTLNVLESGKVDGATINGVDVTLTNKILIITIDKATVGLDQVDNTSDADKPISTAAQEAFDLLNKELEAEAQTRETADNTLQANITETNTKLGDVTKLHTATQTSAVEAINEVLATRVEADPVGVMLVNYLYPIGSVYLSLDATFNPNTAWQGTKWELIEAGRYLRATQTEADVGQSVDEKLPNIQGGAGRYVSVGGHFNSGAMYISDGVNLNGYGGAGGYMHYSVRFNANRYSSVYQDGAKVTPNSIDIYMWKRIEWNPYSDIYTNIYIDKTLYYSGDGTTIKNLTLTVVDETVKTNIDAVEVTFTKLPSPTFNAPNTSTDYALYFDTDKSWWVLKDTTNKKCYYLCFTEDEAKANKSWSCN